MHFVIAPVTTVFFAFHRTFSHSHIYLPRKRYQCGCKCHSRVSHRLTIAFVNLIVRVDKVNLYYWPCGFTSILPSSVKVRYAELAIPVIKDIFTKQ